MKSDPLEHLAATWRSLLLTLALTSGLLASAQTTYLSANASDPDTTHGEARLLHYIEEDMPIRVFVPPAPTADGEELAGRVREAFRAWATAVPEIVSVEFVQAAGPGVLEVVWSELENRVGSYRYTFSVTESGQYRFRTTEVHLDPRHEPEDLYRYALLQAGHALGLLGRSPFEGDAMSAQPSGTVSDRDAATLRALYALPSGTVLRD